MGRNNFHPPLSSKIFDLLLLTSTSSSQDLLSYQEYALKCYDAKSGDEHCELSLLSTCDEWHQKLKETCPVKQALRGAFIWALEDKNTLSEKHTHHGY